MSSPDASLYDISQGATYLPDEIIAPGDVQILGDTMRSSSPTADVYSGFYKGIPARFTEYRQLTRHTEAGFDVRDALVAHARLRREYYTPRHVRVAGFYKTSDAVGSRVYLVESPYEYRGLKEHLVDHPEVDRIILLKEALKIVDDLHTKGIVLGSIGVKDFVIDVSSNIILSGFEYMRVEAPNEPFHPSPCLSVAAMACMAPELLQSFKDDGNESLTQASDIYGIGCFAYELFTGQYPFAKHVRDRTHRAHYRLISAVVDHDEQPRFPAAGSNSYTRFGLTEAVCGIITSCWARNPATRPTVTDLLLRL